MYTRVGYRSAATSAILASVSSSARTSFSTPDDTTMIVSMRPLSLATTTVPFSFTSSSAASAEVVTNPGSMAAERNGAS